MNSNQVLPKATTKSTPCYTVDSILNKINISSQVTMWKKLDSIIRVKGTVQKINFYDQLVYFSFKCGGQSIKVSCPIECAPREGEHLVIEGVITLKPSRFQSGLEVILTGSPISTWVPRNKDRNEGNLNIEKNASLKLGRFLKEISYSASSFVIFGSMVALRDVTSQIEIDQSFISTCEMKVSDKKNVMTVMKSVISESDLYGFAIVRGGDDQSLEVWNDSDLIRFLLGFNKPFYTALGHTHSVTLADKYADESFHTPTHLGSSIKHHLDEISKNKRLRLEVDTLKDRINKISNDKDRLQKAKNSIELNLKRKNKRIKECYIVISVIILAIIAIGNF